MSFKENLSECPRNFIPQDYEFQGTLMKSTRKCSFIKTLGINILGTFLRKLRILEESVLKTSTLRWNFFEIYKEIWLEKLAKHTSNLYLKIMSFKEKLTFVLGNLYLKIMTFKELLMKLPRKCSFIKTLGINICWNFFSKRENICLNSE